MKLAPPDDRDGLTPPRVLVALCLCALLPLLAYAAAPAWWSERSVTIAGATPDDYAPVNQGQLKNIAVAAIAELDAKLPGGAGDALHALANNWATLNPQSNDYTAVNLGQLKNTAKPFYDRLILAGLADRYPWADASPPRDDFAIANIGQVKNLFSFALPDVVGVDGPLLDRLAAGSVGSLALETDGRVWIWGDAIAGGNGARVAWPRRINGLSGVRSVAAGQGHVAVLRSGGSVWTWGDNAAGQLGDGTTASRATPAAVPNVANALAVKAGDSHTLVLQDDGTVLAWGANYYGQLGVGHTEASVSPVMVTGLTDVRKIAAGHSRSVALKNDGTVWTWGYEHYAWQTGDDVYSATPVKVIGLTDVIDIAAGYEHVVAVRSDGTVWAWGSNYSNQVANGYGWWQYQDSPFQVPNLPPIVAVASRFDHTVAIAEDGTVWAWGYNGAGQLGDGTSAQRRTPVQVSGLTEVIAVATDYSYSLAMRADGSVWAWGYGAQGTAPGADLYVPQPVIFGLADANGNGMDDRWEMQYFWNLEAAAGGDEDGDGLTNLQEFQQGTDPRDYFNGTTPTIEVLSGNNQMSDPETFAPDGLTVRVLTAAGVPLVNAPVTFNVTQGWGNLALTPGGDLEWGSVTVRTDTEGNAAAFYRLPPYADDVSLVTASAGPSAAPAAVTFTATTTNPPPPEAASQVNATRNEDGTVTITWRDNSTNEEAFIVEMQAPDGSWQAIAWLDPNTTTYTTTAAGGGNFRVRAPRYGASAPAEETNPPKTSYAIIDLGEKHTPMRVTNSGYVLLQAYYPTPPKRWYQGNVETLTGGDDNTLVGAMDINEAGTVVGSVLLYRPGSAPEYGTASWLDSEWSWYRRTDYGVRRASRWDAGKTAAAPLTAKSFPFSIYDGREGQPWVGSAASASAITIDDNGHIYGWSIADYGEFTPYYPPPDDFYDRTRWGAAYSGYDFTANKVLGDQKVIYHSEPLYSDAEKRYTDRFVTEGDPYYIVKARGGSTIGGFASHGAGWIINGKEEDFRGINLNSHGAILIGVEGSPSSHYIYDPSNGSRTSLGVTPPGWFGSAGQPQALNHRTIAVTDATGQQTTKVSPQVVGYVGSNWGSSGAALWEEDPKSGQYWMRYLNQLLPDNSGWSIDQAYDINDNGVIACVGWYHRPPMAAPERRGCLMVPVGFHARPGKINDGFDAMGAEPWASVPAGGRSDVVEFAWSGTGKDALNFVVASGDASLEVASEAPLNGKIAVALIGKSDPGTAVVEARSSGGTVVGRLNVLVLPVRTLGLAIYRIEDKDSLCGGEPAGCTNIPGTAENDAALDDAIIDKLNEVYKQAAIRFTKVTSERKNVRYDTNNDGRMNVSRNPGDPPAEEGNLSGYAWGGQIRLFLFKRGSEGIGGVGADRRGNSPHVPYAFVFLNSPPDSIPIFSAHELGHALNLDDEDGPFPAGTWGLMWNKATRSPGNWLRYDDWETTNTDAGKL